MQQATGMLLPAQTLWSGYQCSNTTSPRPVVAACLDIAHVNSNVSAPLKLPTLQRWDGSNLRWVRDDRFAGKPQMTTIVPKSGTPYTVSRYWTGRLRKGICWMTYNTLAMHLEARKEPAQGAGCNHVVGAT